MNVLSMNVFVCFGVLNTPAILHFCVSACVSQCPVASRCLSL